MNEQISSPFMSEYRALRRRQFWAVVKVVGFCLAGATLCAWMIYENSK